MTGCEGNALLIQADLDGELDAGRAADLAAHLATCPECAALHADLAALSQRLRNEIPHVAVPEALRRRIAAMVPSEVVAFPARRKPRRFAPVFAFGAGAAIAAAIVLALLPVGGNLDDELIASHVRALQPGHLTDVVSTDQHTVKPWFNGRIDYSPPVKDLAPEGFPLIGGRLDAVGARTVAVLIYRSDKHLIDLFVWPASGDAPRVPDGHDDGFNIVGWSGGGMTFRAVSDVEPAKLAAFVRDWQNAP